MKHFFALTGAAALALLLTACAARRTDTAAEELQKRYAGMKTCRARIETAIVRENETRRYTLDFSREDAQTRVTVIEPEAIAGVTAVISEEDALELGFDGMVLEAGSVDANVSAVNAANIFLRAAADGCVTEQSRERFEDAEETLRLCLETEHAGETLYVTAYFNGADAPLYAEIERDGEILAYLQFTDFAFGDILSDA